MDLLSVIKSELNSAKVRGVLNKFNTAFSEDTQRGTDRLIRNIIQVLFVLKLHVYTSIDE